MADKIKKKILIVLLPLDPSFQYSIIPIRAKPLICFTAPGRTDYPQENPPWEWEQPDDSPLLWVPESLEPHENEDISLQVSSSPQVGQQNPS